MSLSAQQCTLCRSTSRQVMFGLRTVALLVICSSTTLADYAFTTLFSRPGYDFAASMIDAGNVQKFWWCGNGTTPGYSGGTDVIYYRSYTVSTAQWSNIVQVLSPTVGSWEFHGGSGTCNPTVVKGSFLPGNGNTYSYAMYYTAQNDNRNKIGVAFSNDGLTWLKCAQNPIIYPINMSAGGFGAGSSSAYNSNGVSGIYLFEYDDSNGGGAKAGWWRYASDGIHFGSPSRVSQSTPIGTVISPNDVAYDPNSSTFYAVMESFFRQVTPPDREGWQFGLYKMSSSQVFAGSGTWQLLGIVDTNLTGQYLNLQPKLRRDGFGNIVGLPDITVHFTRGTNDINTWELMYLRQISSSTTSAFKRYYNPNAQPISDHWVTTGLVTSGWNFEQTLGYLFMAPQPGTVPLYGCLAVYDHFVSESSTCEGWTVLGINGWIYSTRPTGVSTAPLYRCLISLNGHTDHFVSLSSACEGWKDEGLIGYAKTQP